MLVERQRVICPKHLTRIPIGVVWLLPKKSLIEEEMAVFIQVFFLREQRRLLREWADGFIARGFTDDAKLEGLKRVFLNQNKEGQFLGRFRYNTHCL